MPDNVDRNRPTKDADRELDARIRAAFEPPPEQVRELLSRSLGEAVSGRGPDDRRGPWRRPADWVLGAAAALGGLAVVAALVARLAGPPAGPSTVPVLDGDRPMPAHRQAVLTIANREGVVTVESPGTTTLIIAPASGAPRNSRGVEP